MTWYTHFVRHRDPAFGVRRFNHYGVLLCTHTCVYIPNIKYVHIITVRHDISTTATVLHVHDANIYIVCKQNIDFRRTLFVRNGPAERKSIGYVTGRAQTCWSLVIEPHARRSSRRGTRPSSSTGLCTVVSNSTRDRTESITYRQVALVQCRPLIKPTVHVECKKPAVKSG